MNDLDLHLQQYHPESELLVNFPNPTIEKKFAMMTPWTCSIIILPVRAVTSPSLFMVNLKSISSLNIVNRRWQSLRLMALTKRFMNFLMSLQLSEFLVVNRSESLCKASVRTGQRTRKDFVCSPQAVFKMLKISLTSSQHAVDSPLRGASSSPSPPVMLLLSQLSGTWFSLCVSHQTQTLSNFFSTAPVSLRSSLPPSYMVKKSLVISSLSPAFGSTPCTENGWNYSEDGNIFRCCPSPNKSSNANEDDRQFCSTSKHS